jgi:hypothetical protein
VVWPDGLGKDIETMSLLARVSSKSTVAACPEKRIILQPAMISQDADTGFNTIEARQA